MAADNEESPYKSVDEIVLKPAITVSLSPETDNIRTFATLGELKAFINQEQQFWSGKQLDRLNHSRQGLNQAQNNLGRLTLNQENHQFQQWLKKAVKELRKVAVFSETAAGQMIGRHLAENDQAGASGIYDYLIKREVQIPSGRDSRGYLEGILAAFASQQLDRSFTEGALPSRTVSAR